MKSTTQPKISNQSLLQLKNRWNKEVIFEGQFDSIKELVEAAIEAKKDLRSANLRSADLSDAKELLNSIDWLIENGEKHKEGLVFYKTFGGQYSPNQNWKIKRGAIIEENVNHCRSNDCGCGVNLGTKKWVNSEYPEGDLWKCLIKFEWLSGVCVPYHTDGKIRVERVKLISKVKRM